MYNQQYYLMTMTMMMMYGPMIDDENDDHNDDDDDHGTLTTQFCIVSCLLTIHVRENNDIMSGTEGRPRGIFQILPKNRTKHDFSQKFLFSHNTFLQTFRFLNFDQRFDPAGALGNQA